MDQSDDLHPPPPPQIIPGLLLHRGFDPWNTMNRHQNYPEELHTRWAGEVPSDQGRPHVEKRAIDERPDWPKLTDDDGNERQLVSLRTALDLRVRPLAQEVVDDIVNNAESREDFHDYNKILNHTIGAFGDCLCELRIASGQNCAQYLMEGENGKTQEAGKDHWCWYIDIAPRGLVCPKYKAMIKKYIGKKEPPRSCDILVKPPTSEWVLARDPRDYSTDVAGRAATDMFIPGKCLNCQVKDDNKDGKESITPENEYIFDQKRKWSHLNIFTRPEKGEFWPDDHFVQPLEYDPGEAGSCHPALVPFKLYHMDTLALFGVSHKHIRHPELKVFWDTHLEDLRRAEREQQEREDQRDAEWAIEAREREQKRLEREEAEKYAASKDKGSWHTTSKNFHPGFYL